MTTPNTTPEPPSFRLNNTRPGERAITIYGNPTGPQLTAILAEAESKAATHHTEMLAVLPPPNHTWDPDQRQALIQAGYQTMTGLPLGKIWRKPILIPGPDGAICSDFKLIPPHLVTCITRIALDSIQQWEAAIHNGDGPAAASVHSQQAGAAFTQLSKLEAELATQTTAPN